MTPKMESSAHDQINLASKKLSDSTIYLIPSAIAKPVARNSEFGIMAAKEEVNTSEGEDCVYRISTAEEWQELQKNGFSFGGDLDKSSGFIHFSKLDQVQSTLHNFFLNTKVELYLLQIDAKKLGEGLIYEVVDGTNTFPHFYGPSRSFSPIPLDAVTKAEKISVADGQFSCSLLS